MDCNSIHANAHHAGAFAAINPAALVFAAALVIQGLLFIRMAVAQHPTEFEPKHHYSDTAPKHLFVIPVFWSATATVAALQLGVYENLLLTLWLAIAALGWLATPGRLAPNMAA